MDSAVGVKSELLTMYDVAVQPKFLTKEERAAEAIKRRQEQVEAQRRIVDEERKKQDEFMKAAKESAGQKMFTQPVLTTCEVA